MFRQLGASDLHPPVFPGLLIGDFVDAVVVEVADFPSPVTPADPGRREAVVVVMTMSHKNKTNRTDHHHRNKILTHRIITISNPEIDGQSNERDEEYPVADDVGNRWAMLFYI